MFLVIGVLKICSKFTGEHLCQSVISIKLLCFAVALPCNFIEITLRHGCSPVNLLHIFRTPFPRNTSGWLLLKLCKDVLCKILNSASKFKVQAFLICKKIRNTVNKKRGKSFPIIIFIKQIFNTHTCFF